MYDTLTQVDPYVAAYITSLEDANGGLEKVVPGLRLDGKMNADAVALAGQHVANILSRESDPRLKTAIMQVVRAVTVSVTPRTF